MDARVGTSSNLKEVFEESLHTRRLPYVLLETKNTRMYKFLP